MTHNTHQPAIQAWLDRLTPVERHRVCRALNRIWRKPDGKVVMYFMMAYDIEWLQKLAGSTATGGQEIARR